MHRYVILLGLCFQQLLRHSFTTRLLYSLIPSTWYAKNDASIDALTKFMATDLQVLFDQGVAVDELCHKCTIYRLSCLSQSHSLHFCFNWLPCYPPPVFASGWSWWQKDSALCISGHQRRLAFCQKGHAFSSGIFFNSEVSFVSRK